jgi:hypothetical protein
MSCKRFFLTLLMVLSLFMVAFSQGRVEELTINNGCNYSGESFSSKIYTFESDRAAIEAVDSILAPIGLVRNFDVRAADVDNAAAVIRGETRYLLYNQEFIRRVKAVTKTDWAAVSIMAHEIGHHLNGHTLTPGGSRPPTELEADSFSGFVLYKMGATLEQAQAAMNALSSDAGSSTHPPKRSRLAAIESGWTKAKDLDRSKSVPESREPIREPVREPVKVVTLQDLELSFKSNLFDETIRMAKLFLETTPNSKEAHTYLGISLLIKKDVDNAVAHLERAVRLGEPMTFPVKRLREPLIGHGLDVASVTITMDNLTIQSGKSSFQANFSNLTDFRIEYYNPQCPIVFFKGTFTESEGNPQKTKQDVKKFNLFPPSATLQPMQQGNLVYNVAACTDEGIIPMGLMKLLNRVMATKR